jgi:adenylate cyclase
MTTQEVKRKLAAILSADVKGYSRLMGEDEEWTVRTLSAYRKTIRDLIQQYRGRVVDAPGDNILTEFASVVDAVQCAVEIQQVLRAKNAVQPETRRMDFRIGINLGDVIEEGEQIYGDGVNIAARVEGLAEAGGICISESAYQQIENKLPLRYDYLGEHEVKNIAKPVRVYRAQIESETVSRKPLEVASKEKMAFPLPDKPSVAVLPFVNMSEDPKQEYFADGISEDLITDLSKIPDLLVISRLSSFIYKGKNIKVQQIAEGLGVRYVLEGSVRKAENRVRINAQLIDGASGHHLWADRYDGDMNDVFALQDKITKKIAASLAVKLTQDDQHHLRQKGTNNIEAYEAYLKGSAIADSLRYDPEKFAESLPWFEKAIELDPDYNRAYAALAETYIFGSEFGIQDKLGISTRLARMRGINYLRMAMKNPTEIAYRIAARLYTSQGQHEKALAHGMGAIALSPNAYRSNSFMALTMIYAGRPDEGIPFCERMRRADPACLW